MEKIANIKLSNKKIKLLDETVKEFNKKDLNSQLNKYKKTRNKIDKYQSHVNDLINIINSSDKPKIKIDKNIKLSELINRINETKEKIEKTKYIYKKAELYIELKHLVSLCKEMIEGETIKEIKVE